MSDELKHYGMPRRSGRYPWGSGQDGYQRAITFRSHIQDLKSKGMSEVDIAKVEGIKVRQLRARMSIAKNEKRAGDRTEALRLKDKGYSTMEIARRMSGPDKTWNESSIRSLLDPILAERASITTTTANMLKENVDKKRFIDIGAGVENYVGVSRTRLNTAVAELEEQGYKVHKIHVDQLGMPGKFTIVKV
jgi:DNA-binding CsgD family transcriptional regulator